MGEGRGRHHPDAITLRPVRPEDEAFLYDVCASTRLDELAPFGGSADDWKPGCGEWQELKAAIERYRPATR